MPESSTLPYNYIAVEGNIGAGKSTLSRRLSQDFNRRLILEEFEDNPFLPLFYADPARYAFPVELFFMAERHKQLERELSQGELFTNGIVSDYVFVKTLLFARNSLTDQEFRLFSRLFTAMDAGFPPPDLLVYLHRPVEALQANIARRGRSFETDIKDAYLQSVQAAYFNYFRTQQDIPVIAIDLGDADFVADPSVYDTIVGLLREEYAPGLHTLVP